jgi:exopolyphosphatase/guanosine-5'-triphosphate,3'-diphosphate pyrophosphatase
VPPRVAAADVGSNTVHLLVADPTDDGGIREVRRTVLMPRIGAAVNATGRIGAAKIAEVAQMLHTMAETARDGGAGTLLLCATEAVRRAADRDEAIAAFGDAAGVPCRLISGDVEARLSFRGAVAMAAPEGIALVCDIGGGSTEFAVGTRQRGIDALASLPIGSGVATDRWLHSDPPSEAQRERCAQGIAAILRDGAPSAAIDHAIATGGTATSLPRLLACETETEVDAADLERCRAILRSAPSAEVARTYDLDPARARVLAGGVEIVDAIRALYDVPRIRVTIHGLRTGMILAYTANGDRWIEG